MFALESVKVMLRPVIIFCLLLLLSACQTAPQLSTMQKRQITTGSFAGSYDNVYAATVSVIQDHQYIIRQSNKNSGLITAETNKDEMATGMSFLGMPVRRASSDLSTTTLTRTELSATISKLNNKNSEVRFALQQQGLGQDGRVLRSKSIYDAKLFESLFAQVRIEIQRRQALGRA